MICNSFRTLLPLGGFIFLIWFSGCSDDIPQLVLSDGTETPVIPEDTLILILKDMHIVQAGVDHTIDKPSERPEHYRQYNRLVLERHNVNPDRFFSSYKYYQENPALMDSIYVRVIEKLNMEISTYQKSGKTESSGRMQKTPATGVPGIKRDSPFGIPGKTK